MNISMFVLKLKLRMNRGQSWVYYIKDIAYVFLTLYIAEDILRRFGISDPNLFKYLYIILPIIYFICCYVIGYLDEKYGIWKLEYIYNSKDLNPFMESLNAKIEEIHKKVQEKDEYK